MKEIIFKKPYNKISINQINDVSIVGIENKHGRHVLIPNGNNYVAHDLISSAILERSFYKTKKDYLINEQENLKEAFVFEDRKELTKWLNEEDK